ncbi:MAG: VWA domain-containing protein [Gammaproteobacteria bacterium]|nr:VWA domain-containing protein [Gammaproteobacteria bacterium]NNC77197.1 VWA domain-containing protein [Woeseiaceae bacterium]
MIDWRSIQFAQSWPLWVAVVCAGALALLWFTRRHNSFPDLTLVDRTRRGRGLGDRAFVICAYTLLALLIIVMMEPSLTVSEKVQQRARDFVILVDTSRSMRHDTDANRHQHELHYPRRVGAFSEAVRDPNAIPQIARFELARESLFRFLTERRSGDRVALAYFNDDVHPVSALTSNLDFVIDQLGLMDDYVNWGTDIAAAMDSGMSLLDRYPGNNRRALILITDAETRYTQDLEDQFGRLANAGLSFYLLWITADADESATEDALNFTTLADSAGTVFAVKDPNPDNIQDALIDIGRLESYRYDEQRHRTVRLAEPLLKIARIAFLVWLLLGATIFHPSLSRRTFGTQAL